MNAADNLWHATRELVVVFFGLTRSAMQMMRTTSAHMADSNVSAVAAVGLQLTNYVGMVIQEGWISIARQDGIA
jgi:hypothetical protein